MGITKGPLSITLRGVEFVIKAVESSWRISVTHLQRFPSLPELVARVEVGRVRGKGRNSRRWEGRGVSCPRRVAEP